MKEKNASKKNEAIPITKSLNNGFQTLLRAELTKDCQVSEISSPPLSDKTAYNQFIRSILDQKKDYPLPIPILELQQNGQRIPFMTLKSFSLWQGRQKSKKTTVLAYAVSKFIAPSRYNNSIDFIGCIQGVALFFDCEQGESYAARTMRLILKLAGVESSPNLIYSDLRGFTPKERMEIIQAAIEHTPDVKLVVIDGLVDLTSDFMDAAEGHMTVTEILKLCSLYNIHVAGVLHQNKGDKNARAHIGSISSQKCEMEISTEVDTNDRSQSQVICVNSRGLPFESFAIRWDNGSLPCINQEWNSGKAGDIKTTKNYEKSKEIAESVFKPLAALSHSEAIKGIMNAANKSESTAKRLIKDFIGWDFISKGDDGNYRIKRETGSRVHEGSNGGHEPVQ